MACLFVLVVWLPVAVHAREIVALLDRQVESYSEALAGFEKGSRASIRVLGCRENGSLKDEQALIPRLRAMHPDQILVVGREPLKALAGRIRDIPIIFCMVANPDSITAGTHNITGVSTNTPPDKLMTIARLFQRYIHRIGVVYNPDESAPLVEAAREYLARYGQELDAEPARSPLAAMGTVRKLMPKVDAYWCITDSTMLSADVIRYVFATAHRYDIPLIGGSDKLVRAGSLFAYSPDNVLMGRQAASLSNQVLAGAAAGSLAAETPKSLSLSVNQVSFERHGIPLPESIMRKAGHIY